MNINIDKHKAHFGGESKLTNYLDQEWRRSNPHEYIKTLEMYSKGFMNKLSNNQLRNVFDKIKQIKENKVMSLQLLRPNIVNAAARQSGNSRKAPLAFLAHFAGLVTTDDQFNLFVDFLEALVGYHKLYEEKQ